MNTQPTDSSEIETEVDLAAVEAAEETQRAGMAAALEVHVALAALAGIRIAFVAAGRMGGLMAAFEKLEKKAKKLATAVPVMVQVGTRIIETDFGEHVGRTPERFRAKLVGMKTQTASIRAERKP